VTGSAFSMQQQFPKVLFSQIINSRKKAG